MFGRRKTSYSLYKPGSKRKDKILKLTLFLLTAVITYEIITNCLLYTVKIENNAMSPGLLTGDRILILKAAYEQNYFGRALTIPGIGKPQRGDIAVYRPEYSRELTWFIKPLNSIVSFITLQNKSISQPGAYANSFAVKRILALPGDSIKVTSRQVHIKPAGGNRFLTEFELTDNKYSIDSSDLPENWNNETNPFNTDTAEYFLENNLYFIISDNRKLYPDPHGSGLVEADQIQGRALLRYWPLKRINVF